MNEQERNFWMLKEFYDRLDMELISKKGCSVFPTEFGLYGSSSMPIVFELFRRIELQKFKRFVDLGSGDGRIVLLASLFTHADGIEGDENLHNHAQAAKKSVKIPELKRSSFICGDYMEQDLSGYDVLFIYADHNWPDVFQEKLLREVKGIVLSLHNIYRPDKLPRGKTYWIEQTPFFSYTLA